MMDNSDIRLKTRLRRKYLEMHEDPKVLDLFCGDGIMYREVYQHKADSYLGIDHKQIFDKALCVLQNNNYYIRNHDMTPYNFFDMDAYGNPYTQLLILSKKTLPKEYSIVLTDGYLNRHGLRGTLPKVYAMAFDINRNIKIPLLNRFHREIVDTFMNLYCRRANAEIVSATAAKSRGSKHTYYYGFKLQTKKDSGLT